MKDLSRVCYIHVISPFQARYRFFIALRKLVNEPIGFHEHSNHLRVSCIASVVIIHCASNSTVIILLHPHSCYFRLVENVVIFIFLLC